jgi:hypothetical membrane protein
MPATPSTPTSEHQTRTARTTVALLGAGALAGPLYIAVATLQILLRDGFDPTVHPVSALSNGAFGWVQIANFIVAGMLTFAGAIGLRRLLTGSRAGTWAADLLAVYGLSLVAAGVLVADPVAGFPPDATVPAQDQLSASGLGHFAAGGLGFLAFTAACLCMARHHRATGRTRAARIATLVGLGFLFAFAGIASGGGAPALNLAFTAAVIVAWTWVTTLFITYRRQTAPPSVRS